MWWKLCFVVNPKARTYNFISKHVPCTFYHFVLWPTNTQLFHKLSHYYMFQLHRVIPRELIINSLPSCTSISNAALGITVNSFANSCIWNSCVTWQGIDYRPSEDDTIVSEHVECDDMWNNCAFVGNSTKEERISLKWIMDLNFFNV